MKISVATPSRLWWAWGATVFNNHLYGCCLCRHQRSQYKSSKRQGLNWSNYVSITVINIKIWLFFFSYQVGNDTEFAIFGIENRLYIYIYSAIKQIDLNTLSFQRSASSIRSLLIRVQTWTLLTPQWCPVSLKKNNMAELSMRLQGAFKIRTCQSCSTLFSSATVTDPSIYLSDNVRWLQPRNLK